MKKSIKILTLVLSLALICGALIVAAFAEGETEIVGVRVDNHADMEGTDLTEFPTVESKGTLSEDETSISGTINQLATNLDKDTGAEKVVQFKHQMGNTAIGTIVTNPVDGNKYFTVEHSGVMTPYIHNNSDKSTTYTQSSGQMLDSYTKYSGWNHITDPETRYASDKTTGEYWGIDTKYFVMDVDLLWPDPADYDTYGAFYPYIGYTNTANGGFTTASSNVGLSFQKSGNNVIVKFRGVSNAESFVIGSDGSWSHITYIMGFDTVTDDNGTNLVMKQYLAIDGKIVDAVDSTNAVAATSVYNGDRTLLYARDIRLEVFGRVSTTNVPASGAVDNYVIRTLTNDYNGNLATVLAGGKGTDLTAWESNLYDADAMPYGKTVATNGETPYDSLQKAIDAAAEGDTITLCSNVTGTVTVGKDITINYGDYTMAAPATANKLVAVNDETNKAYTFEPADVEYVKSGVTYYALLSDSASFSDVIAAADADADVTDDVATIKLLKDVDLTLTGEISVSKNLTIDLGGKTLYMRQHAQAGFAPGGSKSFKLMNGTIVASTGGEYDTTNKKAHAIVTSIGSKANVYFDDVDTYGYAITYSWGNAYSVYVDGGEHHVHSNGYTHMTYAGWICGNNDITATVKDADIYLDYSSGTLVGFQNYKSTATTPKSVATFDNCNIIGSSATHSIIAGLNKYSTVAFTNSNIYGKIAPVSTNNDGDNKKNPVDGSITIGAGCKISGNVIGNSVVKWADDVTPINVGDTETLTVNKPSGYYSNGDFKITATTLYAEYSWCDKALLGELSTENNDSYFTITSGENTYYTDSLRQALSLAPAGATITLNKDYEAAFAGNVGVITGGLTIDLNGYRLTISQSAYNAYITIATNDTVTIKNGVLVAALNNDFVTILANDGDSSWKNSDGTPKYTRALDAGLPVFVAYEGANGVTGLAVDLVVEGVNTYVPTIFHNESATGSKLTVKGGVHQSVAATLKFSINGTKTSALGNGAVFQSRTNMTAKFIDSDIYMNYCSSIFANSHKNVPSGTTAYTEVVYTDCSIIQSATDGKPLIMYSDSNTYAYFNGCGVFAHLLVPSKETGTAMGSGNIIFGEGTHHGYADTTKTLIEPTIVEGLTKFEFASTIKITDTVTAQNGGQFHMDSNSDGYSDGVSSFLKASAFSNSQTCNYAYGTPAFEIVKGGATIQRPNTNYYTLKEALADADEGSTITLLADVKIGATSKISITKDITIDLNGHVLDAFLPYHYASNQYYTADNNKTNSKITTFGISAEKTVTFKGEKEGSGIIFGSYTGSNTAGTFITPGKNSVINFEGANLNVSGPMLAGTWGVTGWTVNLNGGYYNKNNSSDGTAWIYANATSTGVTVNIENAVYNAEVGGATGAAMTANVKNSVLGVTAFATGAPDITFNISDTYIVNALKPNKVVLGANCYIRDTSWLNLETTTFAAGVGMTTETNKVDHVNYTQNFAVITDENGIVVADPNAAVFTKTTVTNTYSVTTTTVSGGDTDYKFSYTSDGATYYGSDLADVVASAPAGSTITLLVDNEVYTPGKNIDIKKDVTIDLDGKSFTILHTAEWTGMFNISATDVDFKITNGTIKWQGTEGFGKASALIRMNGSASNITVNLDSLTAYGAVVLYNENCTNSTVTVTGGEYYLSGTCAGTNGAAFESRIGTIFNISNAKFYMDGTQQGIIASMTYKDANEVPATKYTFTNCDFYHTNIEKSIVQYTNEYTSIAFNNCKIVGSITTAQHSWDTNAGAATDGDIVFGDGTTYMGGVTLSCVTFESALASTADSSISIEFADTSIGTKTAEGTVVTVGGEVSDIIFTFEANGETNYFVTLADAVAAAPAGATIVMHRDVTVETDSAVAIINKALTIDLGGYHLQVVQAGAGAQIFVNTTATVTITNGRISCAANATYRKSLTSTASNYDVGEPLFVANTVAVDLVLNGVSTYTAGIFYNEISGSKFTVTGGYHHQNAITYEKKGNSGKYIERGLVISKANITTVFNNASIYMDWCGGLLISSSQNETDPASAKSTFTYNGCVINFTGSSNQIIRSANGKTYVYFNDSDVYGAFVQPTADNATTYGSFTSANLVFDENCTWGYPTITDKTLVTPTLPEGYVLSYSPTATSISYTQYTCANQIHAGTFTFASASTSNSIKVSFKVAKLADQIFSVTSGSNVAYYETTDNFADIIKNAASGSVVTLLVDITIVTDRYLPDGQEDKADNYVAHNISITKGLTFDLNGKTLTIEQHAKNCGFYVSTTELVTFKNGTVTTVAHSEYNTSGSTFAFMNVSTDNANILFDNVNSYVGALVYSYGSAYTITINGGIHQLVSSPRDTNTPGFISGQHNITATVNNATIYVDNGYVLGASSYKAIAASKTPSSTFTFNKCQIIAPAASKNIVGQMNEKVYVYFNACCVYGSITPSINDSDVNKVAASTADNIKLTDGTLYSSASNLATATTMPAYVIVHTVTENVDVGGKIYAFDRKADYVYVIWHDENGNVLQSDKIVDGYVLNAYEYEGKGGTTNGWYKIGGYVANSWTDVLGGSTAVDLSKIDVATLTTSISFYPQVNENNISAYLTAAMYNLSIAGAIRNNLYIPETPDNVEILGVYVGDREVTGYKVLFRDHNNAPVYYTMYVINEVGTTEFTKATTVTVKYMVNGSVELAQSYSLSPENYANIIYNDSQKTSGNVYNDKAYNVVADLVRYSYMLTLAVNVEADGIEALYNKMSGLCSDLPANMTGSTANRTDLVGYVKSVAYEASSYEPRWKITLVDTAKVTDVKITIDGYRTGVNADRTNYGTLAYNLESIVKSDDGKYYLSAYTQNIPIYNIPQMMTITVTVEGGAEYSGTYDLKSYYSGIVGELDDNNSNFLKSVVALANSTIAYKFPEGKMSENDVSEFWNCDHEGATLQETVVADKYVFTPRLCTKCDTWLFTYQDYGAVANGQTNHTRADGVSGTNDYEAIYWTHANANEWAQRSTLNLGKHTAVVGNLTPAQSKNYYISIPEGTGVYKSDLDRDGTPETTYTGEKLGTITIATDTAWNGTNFIIDDNAICLSNAKTCTCSRVHGYTKQSIFTVDEYGNEDYVTDITSSISATLKPGDDNIGYAPGRKMLVYLVNSGKKIWYRYGSNANDGVSSNEIIIVDENGNIDPSTPIQWDYDTITSAKGYAIDTNPIRISGLDAEGNINSFYETFVNNDKAQEIPNYQSISRNILIQRSNATVEGIYRYFTEEPSTSENERTAYSFICVQWCSNATIKDMSVVNHNAQSAEDGISQGSYEFNGSDANAVSWINCVTRNMFSSTSDGSLQAYPVYRGLFGTNRIRNMYLKDCYLNSFDAHTGANNVTIEDSTFEHMNFVGGGKITLKNVVIYTSDEGTVVNLREDYGSIWKGDLDIDGLEVRYCSKAGSYKPARISLIKGNYQNQYFGFDDGLYMPENVTINNFHIRAYSATVSDGVRDERLGALDDSNMSVYYYYGTANSSYGIEAGDMHNLKSSEVATTTAPGANLPTDKATTGNGTSVLNGTKNLTITNSVSITLPTGNFWINMNVTKDGTVYALEEKKIFGSIGLGSYEWKAQ